MKVIILNINPMPNDTPDIAVALEPDGTLVVIELMHGSSSKDLMLNNRISFDWDSGPGDAFNITQNKPLNINIVDKGLTPQEVRDHFIPNYPV